MLGPTAVLAGIELTLLETMSTRMKLAFPWNDSPLRLLQMIFDDVPDACRRQDWLVGCRQCVIRGGVARIANVTLMTRCGKSSTHALKPWRVGPRQHLGAHTELLKPLNGPTTTHARRSLSDSPLPGPVSVQGVCEILTRIMRSRFGEASC